MNSRDTSSDNAAPEVLPYWWYPQRAGIISALDDFQRKLRSVHPDLSVTWNPVIERWQVWYKRPRITFWMCPGWLLLFIVEDDDGRYVPLDDRVLACIYQRSALVFGGAKPYFDRIEREQEREAESAARHDESEATARHDAGWDYTLIKTSMYGPSSGSKFVRHHAGD